MPAMWRVWGNTMPNIKITAPSPEMFSAFEEIARRRLFIATLRTQHSDRLDFYDVSVWSLADALHDAYLLGAGSIRPGAKSQLG